MSLLVNQTCLNERLLPNYTHTHTYREKESERERESEREKMKMNPTLRKHKNLGKKQGIQRMSLFILEYYANVKCFCFFLYIKPSSGQC